MSIGAEPRLKVLYDLLLDFVKTDCRLFLDLTAASYQGTSLHLLTEGIWPAFVDGIIHYTPHIFNPGLVIDFHQVVCDPLMRLELRAHACVSAGF